MIIFELENVNPKNRKTGDCVIRAITKASGLEYKQVYEMLFNLSLKSGFILNDKKVYEKLLNDLGFVKMKQPRKADNTKYTIGEIDRLIGSGIAVVSCAHHLTCVKDYVCYDLWDCRYKSIGNYYIKIR